MTQRSQKTWAVIGKISALVSLLGGLIGLWISFSSPHEDLQATLEYASIAWPPSAKNHVDLLQRAADFQQLRKAAEVSDELSEEGLAKDDAILKVSEHLQRIALENRPEFLYRSGFWRAEITNNGDLVAREVAIRLPGAKEAVVTRGGTEAIAKLDSEVISLDTLRPHESLTVEAWAASAPGRFAADRAVLSHSTGTGHIVVLHPQKPLMARVADQWPLLLMVIPAVLVLLFWAFILVVQWLSASPSHEKPEGGPSDRQEPDA